jgi:hypothetical protein
MTWTPGRRVSRFGVPSVLALWRVEGATNTASRLGQPGVGRDHRLWARSGGEHVRHNEIGNPWVRLVAEPSALGGGGPRRDG